MQPAHFFKNITLNTNMDQGICNGPRGFIFDLDGTLANSMPVHLAAWQAVGEQYGFEYTEEDLKRYAGMSGGEIVRIINEKQNLDLDPDEITSQKEDRFLENLHKVEPIEPVVRLLARYASQLPVSVGTGSFRRVALQILEAIGLSDSVELLVTADDVEKHKPDPDTFLKCAELMNVNPEECLVFEDAELGFQAAKNAGMQYIDVRKFY